MQRQFAAPMKGVEMADPEKPRKPSVESIEYQPVQSEGTPGIEPESGQEVSERRDEETDAKTKADLG
jgi:hypothetical protein